MKLVLFLALTVSFTEQANACDNDIQLTEAKTAYEDAKSLWHKADTYLHAQQAFRLAQQACPANKGQLATLSFNYAKAAAFYQEPIALDIYRTTLRLHEEVYGKNAIELALPYAHAAEEAIHRKEPELAYRYLDKGRDILGGDDASPSIALARLHMGLARLYQNSGELERADNFSTSAIEAMTAAPEEIDVIARANMYYWYAQVKRDLRENETALTAYQTSLNLLLADHPRERRVLSLHVRLLEMNHKVGNFDDAVFHCLAAQKWEMARNMALWGTVYDPEHRLDVYKKPKVGQILAGFTKGADCKVRDIIIYKTAGISIAEAKRLIAQAYFPPRFRDGKLSDDQLVEQTNIDVAAP